MRNDYLRVTKNYQTNLQQQQQTLSSAGSSMSSSSTTSFTSQHQHTSSELESLIEELENDKPRSLSQMTTMSSSQQHPQTTSDSIAHGVATFEANRLLYMTSNGSEMDLTLIGKLQRRIAALEHEKKTGSALSPLHLQSSSMSTTTSSSTASTAPKNNASTEPTAHDNNNNPALVVMGEDGGLSLIERLQQDKDFELIKAQELELENQKLREDLNRLLFLILGLLNPVRNFCEFFFYS